MLDEDRDHNTQRTCSSGTIFSVGQKRDDTNQNKKPKQFVALVVSARHKNGIKDQDISTWRVMMEPPTPYL